MKTRAKKPATSKSNARPQAAESLLTRKHTLEPNEEDPPKVFVLPQNASPSARITTLPHPATSKPHRYFIDPQRGFYEFTRVSAPKKACRSWLLAPEKDEDQGGRVEDEGYILQDPGLLLATPIDPLFLLLPALWKAEGAEGQDWGTLHDRLFQSESGGYEHLHTMLQAAEGEGLETRLEERMRGVCDCIEMGDETSYKLSVDKLAEVVYGKAQRMVKASLPASMEEHFVKRQLEVPELSLKREESSFSMVNESQDSGIADMDAAPGAEANLTEGGNQTTVVRSENTMTTGGKPSLAENSDVANLLRLRTALNYLSATYIPPTLSQKLSQILATLTDFSPLDAHLSHISKLKSEAQALRSISDNISRKRGMLDDEEALEKAEAKKRKKEEEDAKKKSMSHGVKKLAKADTSGMKKMSSFFAPKGGAK